MSIYQSQEVTSEPTVFYCYLYRDIDGTPIYVGKGKNYRAFGHIKGDTHLSRLLQKRLKAGFKIEPEFLCKDVDEEFAFFVEEEMIRKHGRVDLKTGTLLNLTDGGEGPSGYKHSAEYKANKSISMKGNTHCLGYNYFDEHNKAKQGYKHSIESNAKQSIAMKGKPAWNKGISISEEQKDKISETLKGRKQSPEAKAKQIAAQTGQKQDVVTCPHCQKIGGKGSMKRYHSDNCKMKNSCLLSQRL